LFNKKLTYDIKKEGYNFFIDYEIEKHCKIVEIEQSRGKTFIFTLDSKKGKIKTDYEVDSHWKKQKLLFMFRTHWLQKEKNIRYVINILFLLAGIIIAIIKI